MCYHALVESEVKMEDYEVELALNDFEYHLKTESDIMPYITIKMTDGSSRYIEFSKISNIEENQCIFINDYDAFYIEYSDIKSIF